MATMTMTQTAVAPARESAADTKGVDPLTIWFEPAICMTEEQFVEFCAQNSELRIERTEEGALEIMPPAKGYTGNQNFRIVVQFGNWAIQDGRGEGFDSSEGFTLPNGAVRAPDVSWVLRSRLDALTDEDREGFWHICPDFVIEIRSASDRLSTLQAKMQEYIDNGARLGWMIDPIGRRAYVYRPGKAVEVLDAPQTLSGEPELAGFTLDLGAIWEPGF